jgi:N-hydroxyarylamine O-acetyltransferase
VAFDLSSYLDRVGLRDESPSLAAVHRAHATTIVFENLDPSTGQPVLLDVDNLADKMVTRGRGGYCFEHNMLLKAALEEMGSAPSTSYWLGCGSAAPVTIAPSTTSCCA